MQQITTLFRNQAGRISAIPSAGWRTDTYFIQWVAIRIVHERDEVQKQSFPAHAQPFAQPLGRNVIVLGVGVYAPRVLFLEEVFKNA